MYAFSFDDYALSVDEVTHDSALSWLILTDKMPDILVELGVKSKVGADNSYVLNIKRDENSLLFTRFEEDGSRYQEDFSWWEMTRPLRTGSMASYDDEKTYHVLQAVDKVQAVKADKVHLHQLYKTVLDDDTFPETYEKLVDIIMDLVNVSRVTLRRKKTILEGGIEAFPEFWGEGTNGINPEHPWLNIWIVELLGHHGRPMSIKLSNKVTVKINWQPEFDRRFSF
jgi:hypothetical protein